MMQATQEAVKDVMVAGLDSPAYASSGNWETGFYHNYLNVDLEELAAGNLDKAFSVSSDVHETAWTDLAIHEGIVSQVRLPSGVTAGEIQRLCNSIAERREELTEGFSVQARRGSWEPGTGEYWKNEDEGLRGTFLTDVNELDCLDVYDLAFDENRSFVADALRESGLPIGSETEILSALREMYTDGNTFFVGHEEAAKAQWVMIEGTLSRGE